jgi:hypothetical protein
MNKMIRRFIHLALSLILALVITGTSTPVKYDRIAASDGNLLTNPYFEEGDFHWYPPNHYIAPGWSRWWTDGTPFGEYTDANGRNTYDGNRMQVYHSFYDYEMGIFQVVDNLTPCRPYEFSMHTRSQVGRNSLPHSRIGLDPKGTKLTDDGPVEGGLPPKTAWSREQTAIDTWEQLSVRAEPQGERMTAILYAAPRPNLPYTTMWDTGSLIPVTYDNGLLPAPTSISAFIYNISVITGTEQITITWQTTEAASASQVWYNIITSSPPLTPTTTMTHTSYFPLISNDSRPYPFATGISFMRATEHQVLINRLNPGQGIRFIIVARRLNEDICETVRSESIRAMTASDSQ